LKPADAGLCLSMYILYKEHQGYLEGKKVGKYKTYKTLLKATKTLDGFTELEETTTPPAYSSHDETHLVLGHESVPIGIVLKDD